MAIFQVATNNPPKSEIISGWIGGQPWGSSAGESVDVVWSFHLEDPDGEVGMQVHIVASDGLLFQVPLTYRDQRVPDLEQAYIGAMEHSVLGTRHVYDGLGDERFVSVLAGVASCGYGQTLGFARVDGRWQAWPESTKVHGYGAVTGRVLVDRFETVMTESTEVIVRNEHLEMRVFRTLADRPAPDIGMAATWPAQPDPVVLATVVELNR